MNNKTTLGIIAVVIAGVSFFGGVKYDQSKNAAVSGTNSNFASQNGQARMNGTVGQRGGARMMGGGAASGSIISKDATSITISLRDGGSKIVFLSPSTTINKMTTGTSSDLIVGKEVSVNGTPNADGSVNALSIQLRSATTTQAMGR